MLFAEHIFLLSHSYSPIYIFISGGSLLCTNSQLCLEKILFEPTVRIQVAITF